MIILLLIILCIIIYYLNICFKHHYWYEFNRKTIDKFYVDKIDNNVFTKSVLSDDEFYKLENLYKYYFPGIKVTKEKMQNFLNIMPDSVNIYIKEKGEIIGTVFNSILPVIYDKNMYLSNFVDYALVKKGERYRGVFSKLINSIADYSNKKEANMVIFKIDMQPIRTYMNGHNFKSKFYYLLREDYKLKKYENVEKYYFNGIENNILADTYKLSGIVDANIFTNNSERVTLKCNNTIINFKINSEHNYELLYVLYGELENIEYIVSYLFDNYELGVLMVDDIGGNGIMRDIGGIKYNYEVYHYILGMKERLKKEEFYYYY